MVVLYGILLYVLVLAFIVSLALLFTFGEYSRFRAPREVTCPETKAPVQVEVDKLQAYITFMRGRQHLRLKSCSRWPERADCDQDCLAQIEVAPDVTQRILKKWIAGKSCALCSRPLTDADWRRGRVVAVDAQGNIIELRQLPLEQLPQALEPYRPICASCHLEERSRRLAPPVYYKGDRRPQAAKAYIYEA